MPRSPTFFTPPTQNDSLVLLRRIIGRGTEGIVLAAELRGGVYFSRPCAAKFRSKVNAHNSNGLKNEIAIHKALSASPRIDEERGILPCLGVYFLPDEQNQLQTYLVTPECDAILGECIAEIKGLKATNKPLFYYTLFNLLRAMISGLSRLSACNIVHNDLSPNNIGLDENVWRIFDFSQAERYDQFCARDSQIKGTPIYIAPEICARETAFPFSRDVWSIGQIFRQLLGQDIMFNEFGFELPVKYMQKKAAAYIEKRVQHREAGIQSDDHQANIRLAINQASSFQEGIRILVDSMCDILPEYRPNLTTLQLSLIHLATLSASIEFNYKEYQDFIRSLIDARQALIRTQASPELRSGGGSSVEVFDLDSHRSSPILASPSNPLTKTLQPEVAMYFDPLLKVDNQPLPKLEVNLS